MDTERRSTAWWFVVGLVATMVLCLCMALGFLGTGLLGRAISQAFETMTEGRPSSSALPVSTDETSPKATERRSPTTSPTRSATEFPTQPDLAEQTFDLLSTTLVPINDPILLAERFRGISDIPRVLDDSADPISVGTVQAFWVSNVDENTNFQVQAELVYATDVVYFWIEQGVDFDIEDVRELVDFFSNQAYPTTRAFFGSEWQPGVDGDLHLYILFARGLGNSVAGYFSSADELSPLAHEYSNGHEMFYLSADNVFLWEGFTYGVLAHEFQHMIHWFRDRNEETWLNEGFSELSALLNGYYLGGFDYSYALKPDQTLGFWPSSGQSTEHYGQAFLFVAYFMDRFGSEATQTVVADEANGLDSIDKTLQSLGVVDVETGQLVTADDVYADWAAALWLNDPTVSDGRYAYESYTPPQPAPIDEFSNCPLEEQMRQVSQYGVDYLRFSCIGDFNLSFKGDTYVPVLPKDPHSGDFAFWTNRGDESDMTLTRSFDFSGVQGPITFDYWTWYDIEEDWDYLYLVASTDGGENWQILTTPSGTAENPSGNSYGWGYTGYSGGQEGGVWIEEEIDLSDFAGQEVLLRFEYITDAAVNGEGLLLDDLAIEAIGYEEGFEEGDGGWAADGFVRIYNRLPQTFRLFLVEQGLETRVRAISLDENNQANVELHLDDVYNEAVLIVVGTSRYTWQPAYYSVGVTP
jgi:immune inhibitor A